jgi:chromosomal replication initiation ATPase DnaA
MQPKRTRNNPDTIRARLAADSRRLRNALAKNHSRVTGLDTFARIIATVCAHWNVTTKDLEKHDRAHRCLMPRLAAIGLAGQYTTFSRTELGLLFNRDDGAITNALRACQDERDTNTSFNASFKAVETIVETALQPLPS